MICAVVTAALAVITAALFFCNITPFKGGGGGVHPDYFVKLDFEIAVDQQTSDRTFEGFPESG